MIGDRLEPAMAMVLRKARPGACASRGRMIDGVVKNTGQAERLKAEATTNPQICSTGEATSPAVAQPPAATSIGMMQCQKRSLCRSERRVQNTIQAIEQAGGIATMNPICQVGTPAPAKPRT